MTQGRLDIVAHEAARRQVAASGDVELGEGDPSSLLFDMPDILTDGPSVSGTMPGVPTGSGGRQVSVEEPGPVAITLTELLDRVASPSQLSGIDAIAAPELGDLFEALREFELELSAIRRQLHDRIDAIQDEIARRYRDGEASVDALLK